MSSKTELIIKFKDSSQKVKRLNQKTSTEIAKTLHEYREHYHPRQHAIAGRKFKYLVFLVGSIWVYRSLQHRYGKAYQRIFEESVLNSQAKIMPIFQMLEDRALIIVKKREKPMIDFALKSYKYRTELEELGHFYKTTKDFLPFVERTFLANLGQIYSYKPAAKRFFSTNSTGMYNLSI